MSAIAMACCIVIAFGAFAYSANRKFKLLKVGGPENRFDNIGTRIGNLFRIAIFQKKLPKYPVMGPIHMMIFWGFLVLLINTMVLWGRGFDPAFDLLILGRDNILGQIYWAVKDVVSVVVLVAASLALLNRVILKPSRMTKSAEAGLILLIIIVMMAADLAYWGWQLSLEGVTSFHASEPFASIVASVFAGMDAGTVALTGQVGFWAHSVLVLVFLNLLPYGKHFHVVTSLPNVFLSSLEPAGKLPKDANIEKVLAEEDEEDEEEEPVFGAAQIQDFTWKDLLDMYTCTECGRCTDNCPAARTNKQLSPKKLMVDLRNHLYAREKELVGGKPEEKPLVPDVVPEEVVWDCNTCRACEEECPVMNTYVDKMIKMRRHLVEERGEVPSELATALRGMETNANPWNISPMDRDNWTEGLEIKEFDSDECEYLFFVGCAASFDDRAQKISRSLVKLFNEAGVSFGYLGAEEPCCGDMARRGGSESNFRMMADMTIEALNELGVKKIITGCPHCFNTFSNEYPEFGGKWEVIHHTQLLADLVAKGKLTPKESINQKVSYHDGCYLGRYNDVYSAPRQILAAIPGLTVQDVAESKQRSMCCGAGGARYFMEEDADKRVNNKRVEQLLKSEPDSLCTACPYCMTMISDGLKDKDLYDTKGQLDVAEMLAISCGLEERKLLRK
ncbi:MAG: (Fe-S)-binding protein [Deltaproteobacteria bacterium]|nr:(Fe-S)-binding protein [Deltaproteobacteria bacterium]